MMKSKYYDRDKHNYMRVDDDRFATYIYSLIADDVDGNCRTAVELGAGMGRFSMPLVKRFEKVFLVEPTPAYAEMLAQRFPDSHVRVIETMAETFLTTTDLDRPVALFCFHVLHHLCYTKRSVIYQFLKRSGSSGTFVEPNPFNPLVLLHIMLNPDMALSEEIEYLKLTRTRFRQELAADGLTLIRHKPVCLLPPFLIYHLMNKVHVDTLRALEVIGGLVPFLSSYQLIICKGMP